MPFDYYRKLTPKQRKTYRQSDQIAQVDLGDVSPLKRPLQRLKKALEAADRRRVQRACVSLAHGICDALGISRVRVRVGGRRPMDEDGAELYGQCSWEEEETKGALVELWMRTAKIGQVVAFKTFLRTLIHELGHHLDYELHGLDNTFHTEGFFRRESSIFHQLVEQAAEPEPAAKPKPKPKPKPKSKRKSEPEPQTAEKTVAEDEPEPETGGQLGFPF